MRIVKYTCVEKKGKLIIPSFAIGRTQEVVYLLNNFYNEGLLPRIPIYVDSPLAVNATEIFRMHTDQFNSDVQKVMETDSDPFGFGTLKYIKDVNESKKLNFSKEPCVIISASGMMEAGRIKHHLANNIDKPQNTVLAVGYCAPRTLGARILSGEKDISIFGKAHHIKADIFKIDALSGHGDYKEMMDYLECQDKTKLKKVFLVHGEEEAQIVYKTHLKKSGFKHIAIPERGEEFEL